MTKHTPTALKWIVKKWDFPAFCRWMCVEPFQLALSIFITESTCWRGVSEFASCAQAPWCPLESHTPFSLSWMKLVDAVQWISNQQRCDEQHNNTTNLSVVSMTTSELLNCVTTEQTHTTQSSHSQSYVLNHILPSSQCHHTETYIHPTVRWNAWAVKSLWADQCRTTVKLQWFNVTVKPTPRLCGNPTKKEHSGANMT